MLLDELNRCIEEYEKHHFIFSNNVLKNIRNDCSSWKNDWGLAFRKLLARIKKGEGTPAHDEKNGKRVIAPLVKSRYMTIYFERKPDGSHYIYDYKLGFIEI